ncbi:MAG: hypothetical protein AAF431_15580 [Pseudomonadota bacterium]
MRFSRLMFALGLFFALSTNVSAATITINSGSTLTISGGDRLFDCDDLEVIVKAGGSLQITGGAVKDLNYRLESGASFSVSGGQIRKCADYYIIKTEDGVVIVPL